MNLILTEQIIRHILTNVGVTFDKSKSHINSIVSKHYMLPKCIEIEEESSVVKKNVYGCELSIPSSSDKIQFVLADISNNIPEYLFLVRLNGTPPYACHLLFSEFSDEKISSEPLIAYYFNSSLWSECTTYMQATFLAGMEQLKDIHAPWKTLTNYKESYTMLLEFFEYVDSKLNDQ